MVLSILNFPTFSDFVAWIVSTNMLLHGTPKKYLSKNCDLPGTSGGQNITKNTLNGDLLDSLVCSAKPSIGFARTKALLTAVYRGSIFHRLLSMSSDI